MTQHDPTLTPEQITFLAGFADNARTGRRALVLTARVLAWIGTVSGGFVAVWTLYQQWHGRS